MNEQHSGDTVGKIGFQPIDALFSRRMDSMAEMRQQGQWWVVCRVVCKICRLKLGGQALCARLRDVAPMRVRTAFAKFTHSSRYYPVVNGTRNSSSEGTPP